VWRLTACAAPLTSSRELGILPGMSIKKRSDVAAPVASQSDHAQMVAKIPATQGAPAAIFIVGVAGKTAIFNTGIPKGVLIRRTPPRWEAGRKAGYANSRALRSIRFVALRRARLQKKTNLQV
jgi:hypothetical protein